MATISWAVNADGDYGTAANWDASPKRVPKSTDNAVINTASHHTVTHSTNSLTVHSLTVGDDEFDQTGGTLTISAGGSFSDRLSISGGTLSFASGPGTINTFRQTGGTLSGTGTVTVSGAAKLSNGLMSGTGTTVLQGATTIHGGFSLDGDRVLDNQGTVTWTGGAIRLGSNPFGTTAGGGTIKNEAGATFDIQADGHVISSGSGTTAFINAGTLQKSAGTGTATIDVKIVDTGTIEVDTGTLAFTAGGTFTGLTEGAGTVSFGGGGAYTGAVATAGWTITGAGTVVTVGGNAAYGQTFTLQTGATLTLTGEGFGLFGSSSTLSGTINGRKGAIFGTHDTVTVANATLGGLVRWWNMGTLKSDSTLTLGGGKYSNLENMRSGIYNFTGDGRIDVVAGTGSVFENEGLLEKTGGTGVAHVSVKINDHGTTTANSGTLQFDAGTASFFSGAITGTGTVAFANTGSGAVLKDGTSLSVANLSMVNNGSRLLLWTDLSYAGTFTQATGTTLVLGSYLPISTGTALVQGDYSLTLTGSATLAGSVSGPGTLTFDRATVRLNAGANLAGPSVSFIDRASLTIGANIRITSNVTAKGAAVDLAGHTLTLSNGGTLTGGSLDGAGTLSARGTTFIAGTTIDGAAMLANFGTLVQGGAITLGAAGGGTGSVTNERGATWLLATDDGVAAAAGGNGSVTNDGVLRKAAGSGTSVIGVAVINAGTIDVESGTLDIAGVVRGTGSFSINNTSTLEFGAAVAVTESVGFGNTGEGTLLLDDAHTFRGTVAGFVAGDTLDLAGFAADGARLSYTANQDNTGGVLAVRSGTSAANIALDGQFLLSAFHATSDGHGGTDITYATPPPPMLAAHHSA